MVKNNCQIRFSYLSVFDFIILKIDYVWLQIVYKYRKKKKISQYKIIYCSQDSLTNSE